MKRIRIRDYKVGLNALSVSKYPSYDLAHTLLVGLFFVFHGWSCCMVGFCRVSGHLQVKMTQLLHILQVFHRTCQEPKPLSRLPCRLGNTSATGLGTSPTLVSSNLRGLLCPRFKLLAMTVWALLGRCQVEQRCWPHMSAQTCCTDCFARGYFARLNWDRARKFCVWSGGPRRALALVTSRLLHLAAAVLMGLHRNVFGRDVDIPR